MALCSFISQLNAVLIVDSLAAIHQAQIKRTSSKLQNSNNSPITEEKKILTLYSGQISKGKKFQAIVKPHESTFGFYAPISIQILSK